MTAVICHPTRSPSPKKACPLGDRRLCGGRVGPLDMGEGDMGLENLAIDMAFSHGKSATGNRISHLCKPLHPRQSSSPPSTPLAAGSTGSLPDRTHSDTFLRLPPCYVGAPGPIGERSPGLVRAEHCHLETGGYTADCNSAA